MLSYTTMANTTKLGMSFNELSSALRALLGDDPDKDGDVDYSFIQDILPDESAFVYTVDAQAYKQGYDATGDAVKLVGDPVKVQGHTVYKPVQMGEFSLATFGASDGEYEVWGPSKIFEVGDYPKQGVRANESYLDRLVSSFSGCSFKNAHKHDPQSILSGIDLGGCEKVFRKGTELFGQGVIHRAVRLLVPEPKVSIEIESPDAAPRIPAIALLNFPQVDDAKVAATFAAFASARHSKADQDRVQAVHDHAVALGADCPDPDAAEDGAEMAGARHSKGDQADIQSMHDLAVLQGAVCTPSADMGAARHPNDSARGDVPRAKETTMSLIKKALALFGNDPEARKRAGVTEADIAEAQDFAIADPDTVKIGEADLLDLMRPVNPGIGLPNITYL